MRPEIIGFVLGSLIAAYIFREFRLRAGSASIVRRVLDIFAMIGSLVFLGCLWRELLHLLESVGNAMLGTYKANIRHMDRHTFYERRIQSGADAENLYFSGMDIASHNDCISDFKKCFSSN